ncbi:MAG: hypothetical protein ABF303_15805 [Desulfobacterales bacterium]
MLADLSRADKDELAERYSSITLEPDKLKMINRLRGRQPGRGLEPHRRAFDTAAGLHVAVVAVLPDGHL